MRKTTFSIFLPFLMVFIMAGCTPAPPAQQQPADSDQEQEITKEPADQYDGPTEESGQYDMDSWRTMIADDCQSFFDGCNNCKRIPDTDEAACTKMFCEEYQEPKCLDEEKGMKEKCEQEEGTWLEEYQECEWVGQDWCEENGGEFKECESACRHDEEAEMCTMRCVLVCEF